MKRIHIADGLSLPAVEAVTQAFGILAKRRAGKSFTARRLTEQFFRAGQQVVIVDPKGDWWGIRSAADGKKPGLPIVILGGEHGDVPLETGGGEVVAKLAVEEQVSLLLDLSLFRKHEVATFMTAFMENLYRLKAREAYRTPMMLMIDEADAIAPQKPMKGEERMLGAAEDIVRRGGQRGIGCTLISQRSAVVNKNVLTQIQVLVALRTIAPQDLTALDAWVDVHGTEEQRKTLMESLPSLPTGDAWFWSPGWPTVDGIFERVHVLPIETFDSGATPTGQKRTEPRSLADVDLAALTRQMAETIERSKADDPRLLKKTIAELRAELKRKEAVLAEVDVRTKKIEAGLDRVKAPRVVEKPILKDAQVKRLEALATRMIAEADRHGKAMAGFWANQDEGWRALLAAVRAVVEPRHQQAPPRPTLVPRASLRPAQPARPRASDAGPLGAGERAVLTATAQYGDSGVTREQLSILTGYKRSSRDTYLQRIRAEGLVEQRGDAIFVTAAGVAALGADYAPLPFGDELRAHWLGRLPEGERRVFEVVCAAYPKPVDRDAISEVTNYKRSSRDTYLQRLGARKLITTTRGDVRAADELFG